jgi:hypothetical protein
MSFFIAVGASLAETPVQYQPFAARASNLAATWQQLGTIGKPAGFAVS